MKAKSFFLSLSTAVILMNVIIGLGAIFLVERIIPAMNQILSENAYSVTSAVNMLQSVSTANPVSAELAQPKSNEDLKNESFFWENFSNAKKNITLKNEVEILDHIEIAAKDFWAGQIELKRTLIDNLVMLSNVNLTDMKKKETKAKTISLTGAWGLGFLLLFSIGIQMILRTKILNGIIYPLENITSLLQDYKNGNKMRRYIDKKEDLPEIKKTGNLINSILDKD